MPPAGDYRASTSEAKAELRQRMRRARAAIPPDRRAALALGVETHLFGLPSIGAARTVLAYDAFGSEVPTRAIVARVRSEGRRVLFPFLQGRRLEAADANENGMVASGYGPREPDPEARVPIDPSLIDLVLVPGLAFDRAGFRLGYGGGFFDRFLDRLRPDATRVGLAFGIQVVDVVPHDRGDRPVNAVVTESEIILCP